MLKLLEKIFMYLCFFFPVSGREKAYGAVLGMAFVGTVCSAASSGGINVVRSVLTLKTSNALTP